MSCDVAKLEYLKETKRIFREKLDPDGKKITDETPFRDYVGYMGKSAPIIAAVSALGVMGTVGNVTKIEEVEQ